MKPCPKCSHKNREGFMFCEDCGEEIANVESVVEPGLEPVHVDPGIALQVQGAQVTIQLQLEAKTILGRADPDRPRQPDIDLNEYEAFDMGVSVMHAEIQHGTDGIKIMDVGSKNGTYLNGRRLTPQQYYMLRDGDEIRLSRLIAYLRIVGQY